MTRVLFVTDDKLGEVLAGPALRATRLAQVCRDAGHEATVVSTVDKNVEFDVEIDAHDVVVCQGASIIYKLEIWRTTKPVVFDAYDPFHFEQLEQTKAYDPRTRAVGVEQATAVFNHSLMRADFIMCASDRQRHLILGHLGAIGRITPEFYDADPTMRSVVDLVPFSLEADEPEGARKPMLRGVIPGIGADDPVVVWGGGVYEWLDPVTPVRAMAKVREVVPNARLVFMGMKHPNPGVGKMPIQARVREESELLGLTGKNVFFNEVWVPFAKRGAWLREANVGITAAPNHVETEFSFRTRVLDYFWAGLPVVCTEGDVLAGVVRDRGLGISVPPQDEAAMADALIELFTNPDVAGKCAEAIATVRPEFTWDATSTALLEFVKDPRLAVDSELRRAKKTLYPPTFSNRWRGLDTEIAAAKRIWNEEGPTVLLQKSRRRAIAALSALRARSV